MGLSSEEEELIKAAAEGATKGLAEKIPPLYTDLLQPAVQEIGKGLAGLVTLALAPVSSAVWGYDKIANWLVPALSEKLSGVDPENIISPKANILGPAIEGLKFLEDEPELRDMFAQLIADSLNKETIAQVHPGFVESLRNLSALDAKILKYTYDESSFTWVERSRIPFMSTLFFEGIDPALCLKSLYNLQRLGIVNPYGPMNVGQFKALQREAHFKELYSSLREDSMPYKEPKIHSCTLTGYGWILMYACYKKQ
jgi:hypothetical protein